MATAIINPPDSDLVEPTLSAPSTPPGQNHTAGSDRSDSPVDPDLDAADKGIGATLMIGVPLTMFVVCALTVLMCVVGGIPLGEAIGYGTYLAVWIGGGFGVILTGAYYNHVNDGLEN